MLRSIWQILSGAYSRQRTGVDKANIEHLRVDLRFRLAMVEYAYFGRSGRRVSRCLAELKSVLGERGAHRYLRTLDPDLREQFVERFQGAQRSAAPAPEHAPKRAAGSNSLAALSSLSRSSGEKDPLSSNVVPIDYAARRVRSGSEHAAGSKPPVDRSADSGD